MDSLIDWKKKDSLGMLERGKSIEISFKKRTLRFNYFRTFSCRAYYYRLNDKYMYYIFLDLERWLTKRKLWKKE